MPKLGGGRAKKNFRRRFRLPQTWLDGYAPASTLRINVFSGCPKTAAVCNGSRKFLGSELYEGRSKSFAIHCDRLSSDKFQLSQKFLKHFSSIAWKFIYHSLINYSMVYALMTSPTGNVRNFEMWISRRDQIFNIRKAVCKQHLWTFDKCLRGQCPIVCNRHQMGRWI